MNTTTFYMYYFTRVSGLYILEYDTRRLPYMVCYCSNMDCVGKCLLEFTDISILFPARSALREVVVLSRWRRQQERKEGAAVMAVVVVVVADATDTGAGGAAVACMQNVMRPTRTQQNQLHRCRR